jgi:excisionase family DNA binding protein
MERDWDHCFGRKIPMSETPETPQAFSAKHTDPNFIFVREAAEKLNVSLKTIYRMRKSILAPFSIIKKGSRVLIDRTDLERYLATKSGAVATPAPETSVEASPSPQHCPHAITNPPIAKGPYGGGQREGWVVRPAPPLVFFISF